MSPLCTLSVSLLAYKGDAQRDEGTKTDSCVSHTRRCVGRSARGRRAPVTARNGQTRRGHAAFDTGRYGSTLPTAADEKAERPTDLKVSWK